MQEAKDGRQERGQATRQKLVDAAVELFERKGYNRVTVDDICRKAGVSKGAFYGHFESKDQALLEEYLKVDEFYREMLPRVLEEKTFIDRGRAYVRLALKYIAGQGKMVIKVAYSSQIAPGRKASPIASTDRALYTIAEAMAREAVESGELRRDLDPGEVARMIIRSVRGLVYDWCLQDGRFDLEEAGEVMAAVLAEGLRPR
jgi:TetR/AcrR family transcriptional regulator, fatty acid metabolism regulator protein